MFKLAVFTDEVSQDFEQAIAVALEYNLDGLEIRSVWDMPPHQIDAKSIERMQDLLKKSPDWNGKPALKAVEPEEDFNDDIPF